MTSCSRMPDVGDQGQRYEVRYTDCDGSEHIMGWCEDPSAFVRAIESHPSWHTPRVRDRRCSSCDGTGAIGIPGGACFFCDGTGLLP
jgi:hypothetical protein